MYINIKYGHDRFVILIGGVAIRIARFPLVRFIARLAINIFHEGKHKDFVKKFGEEPLSAAWGYMTRGLLANKLEFSYSQTNQHDTRVMLTTQSFFGGWINIQPRGTPICRAEFELSSCPLDDRFVEARKWPQFVHHLKTGQLILFDYGDRGTYELLNKTA